MGFPRVGAPGYAQHCRNLSAQARATHAAKARLIAAHTDEYERYLAIEREERGLPPLSRQKYVDELARKVNELEAELATRNQSAQAA